MSEPVKKKRSAVAPKKRSVPAPRERHVPFPEEDNGAQKPQIGSYSMVDPRFRDQVDGQRHVGRLARRRGRRNRRGRGRSGAMAGGEEDARAGDATGE